MGAFLSQTIAVFLNSIKLIMETDHHTISNFYGAFTIASKVFFIVKCC